MTQLLVCGFDHQPCEESCKLFQACPRAGGDPFMPKQLPDPSECRFCRWWIDIYAMPQRHIPGRSEHSNSDCHRHAPVMSTDGFRRPLWPSTDGNHTCGDFERFRNADGTPNSDTHVTGA